jgi:hypothetical protein
LITCPTVSAEDETPGLSFSIVAMGTPVCSEMVAKVSPEAIVNVAAAVVLVSVVAVPEMVAAVLAGVLTVWLRAAPPLAGEVVMRVVDRSVPVDARAFEPVPAATPEPAGGVTVDEPRELEDPLDPVWLDTMITRTAITATSASGARKRPGLRRRRDRSGSRSGEGSSSNITARS